MIKNIKTEKFFIWLGLIIFISSISYWWGILFNDIYCSGSKTFFLQNRSDDIKNTLWAAVNEEFIWRFIPLVIISFILSSMKYESTKKKKYISCSIAFIIVLLIQVKFGIAHYSIIYETEDWMLKHIVMQGSMGLFYALAYNITQYYLKKELKIHPVYCHITGFLSSVIIHTTVNTLLIIRLTFWKFAF